MIARYNKSAVTAGLVRLACTLMSSRASESDNFTAFDSPAASARRTGGPLHIPGAMFMRHAVTRIATVQVVLCFAPLFAQETERPATTVPLGSARW
jgi:hypothetical protein